jgi:flagellar hook-basal body complex protein FliE
MLNVSGIENLTNLNHTSTKEKQNVNFSDVLTKAIRSVNEQQINYDTTLNRFMLKGDVNIHDLMIAGEKARLSLELSLQIRNKVIESYQEIMRMQV